MIHYVTIDDFKIGLWTSINVENPVVAVNMTVAIERLEGYDLTDEEKTDVTELAASYCGYLDHYRLTGYGDTEFEAIADLFSKATKL